MKHNIYERTLAYAVPSPRVFTLLCNRFPKQLQALDDKINKLEEEVQPWSEAEKKLEWEKLCARIRERFGEDAI